MPFSLSLFPHKIQRVSQIILSGPLRTWVLYSSTRYRSLHSLFCAYNLRARTRRVGSMGVVYLG